jgi:hypothetical protein
MVQIFWCRSGRLTFFFFFCTDQVSKGLVAEQLFDGFGTSLSLEVLQFKYGSPIVFYLLFCRGSSRGRNCFESIFPYLRLLGQHRHALAILMIAPLPEAD